MKSQGVLRALAAVFIIAVAPAACRPGPRATASPPAECRATPAPSQVLVRGYDRASFVPRGPSLEAGSLAVGFVLKDTAGHERTLSGLLAEKPVVMVFGSFTCPHLHH